MKSRKKAASKPELTPARRAAREKAIIADIKAGKLSYRQIAKKHGVSLPTVNNKARKAGISRGRRPGARIVVAGPKRAPVLRPRPAGQAASEAAKQGAKTARKSAPKAGKAAARAGRKAVPSARVQTGRPAHRTAKKRVSRAKLPVTPAAAPMPVVSDSPAPARGTKKGTRRTARTRPATARAGFSEALREVILKYHPSISLRAYERLMKAVQGALA